jgi:hypothetical protein
VISTPDYYLGIAKLNALNAAALSTNIANSFRAAGNSAVQPALVAGLDAFWANYERKSIRCYVNVILRRETVSTKQHTVSGDPA